MKPLNRTKTMLISILLISTGCATNSGIQPDKNRTKATINTLDSLVGSKWRIKYSDSASIKRDYTITFLIDGKLSSTHPNESTPNNDKWKKNDDDIVLSFNNGYAIYTGKQVNSYSMSGTTTNIAGESWKWAATRIIDQ